MATFSTLLCHKLSFHTAALWLLFLRCCAISTLSTMLRHAYFFHAAAPCLLFPRCFAVPSFSTLLRYVTFSKLLCRIRVTYHQLLITRTKMRDQFKTTTRTVDIKTLFGELPPCSLGKPIPNYRAYVDFFYFDH